MILYSSCLEKDAASVSSLRWSGELEVVCLNGSPPFGMLTLEVTAMNHVPPLPCVSSSVTFTTHDLLHFVHMPFFGVPLFLLPMSPSPLLEQVHRRCVLISCHQSGDRSFSFFRYGVCKPQPTTVALTLSHDTLAILWSEVVGVFIMCTALVPTFQQLGGAVWFSLAGIKNIFRSHQVLQVPTNAKKTEIVSSLNSITCK